VRQCAAVLYAFVQDVAATWEQYQRVAETMYGPVPDGLIIHVAGRTDEGYRVIEVWQDQAACERFHLDRLARAASTVDAPERPQPTFRDLRPDRIVVGSVHSQLTTPDEERLDGALPT
jgi:hypothetical protein